MVALPDEALAVSTLRRYATFLGLDEDTLTRDFRTERSGDDRALVTAAVGGVAAGVSAGPDHLRAFTETGEVPQVGGRATWTTGTSGSYDLAVSVGPPTGTFPVVPRDDLRRSRRQVARARRRMHAPTSLNVITWVAAFLVLAIVVGFVLLSADAKVLADAHILKVAPAGSAAAGGTAGPPPSASPAAPRQTFPVQPSGSTSSSASYTVATAKFTVVVATSGPCWVQVTSSSSPVPLVSGVQPAAKVLSYPAVGTMTVEVGSSAVLVGVTIKGKSAFTDAPKSAPFTYTFAPA